MTDSTKQSMGWILAAIAIAITLIGVLLTIGGEAREPELNKERIIRAEKAFNEKLNSHITTQNMQFMGVEKRLDEVIKELRYIRRKVE